MVYIYITYIGIYIPIYGIGIFAVLDAENNPCFILAAACGLVPAVSLSWKAPQLQQQQQSRSSNSTAAATAPQLQQQQPPL